MQINCILLLFIWLCCNRIINNKSIKQFVCYFIFYVPAMFAMLANIVYLCAVPVNFACHKNVQIFKNVFVRIADS